MKDEIKEILDILKDNTYVPLEDGRDYKLLDKGDDKLLLDYIINIQERFNALLEAHKIADELETEYQERNEKAIEYIKSLCYIESKNEWFTYGDDLSPEHIVNILQGEDKDE